MLSIKPGSNGVDFDAPQIELVNAVAQGPFNEGGAAGEGASRPGHDAEMRGGESGPGNPGTCAHGRDQNRDLTHELVYQ